MAVRVGRSLRNVACKRWLLRTWAVGLGSLTASGTTGASLLGGVAVATGIGAIAVAGAGVVKSFNALDRASNRLIVEGISPMMKEFAEGTPIVGRFVTKFNLLTDRFDREAQRFGQFNPTIAVAIGRTGAQGVIGEFRRAQRFDDLAIFVQEQHRFNSAIKDLEAQLLEVLVQRLMPLVVSILDQLTTIARVSDIAIQIGNAGLEAAIAAAIHQAIIRTPVLKFLVSEDDVREFVATAMTALKLFIGDKQNQMPDDAMLDLQTIFYGKQGKAPKDEKKDNDKRRKRRPRPPVPPPEDDGRP